MLSIYLAQINTKKNTCKYDNVIITKHFLHVNHTGTMKAHYKHWKLRNSVPIITIKGEGQFARCSNRYYKQIERYVFFLTIIRPDYNSSQKKNRLYHHHMTTTMVVHHGAFCSIRCCCRHFMSSVMIHFTLFLWTQNMKFPGLHNKRKTLHARSSHIRWTVSSPVLFTTKVSITQLLFVAWCWMTSST